MKSLIIAAGLMFVGVTAAHAYTPVKGNFYRSETPRIDMRQKVQAKRIRQGVRTGALTRREALKLRMQQRRIAFVKRLARADGRVVRHERRKLHRMLDRASKRIFAEKHDNQRRGRRGRGNRGRWNR